MPSWPTHCPFDITLNDRMHLSPTRFYQLASTYHPTLLLSLQIVRIAWVQMGNLKVEHAIWNSWSWSAHTSAFFYPTLATFKLDFIFIQLVKEPSWYLSNTHRLDFIFTKDYPGISSIQLDDPLEKSDPWIIQLKVDCVFNSIKSSISTASWIGSMYVSLRLR